MNRVPKIDVGPAKRPRNGFDCSETSIYSQPAGMLLPVYNKFLQPGDHVSMDITSIVQASTLKGRPFLGMKQNFAAYFVPCRLLWSYSDSFFSGLSVNNTLQSSSIGITNGYIDVSGKRLVAPSFKPIDVLCAMAGFPAYVGHGEDVSKAILKRYNADEELVASGLTAGDFGNYFSGKRVTTRSANDISNDKFVKPVCFDDLGYPTYLGYSRLFDMLGYGSLPFDGNKFVVNPSELVNNKLMDYQQNLFNFLAYQKIYQDHFLDTDYEKPYRFAYNVDHLASPGGTNDLLFDINHAFGGQGPSSGFSLYNAVFRPRYVKYHKDLLNNIQPSPLFVDDVSSTIRTFVHGDAISSSRVNNITEDLSSFGTSTLDTKLNGSSITVQSLRNLFALDKMRQITSRAPRDYRSQIEAHFGVKVDGNRTSSSYLGGFQKILEVSPVIASSDGSTDSSSTFFGQQGSYIDSSSNGHINYDCNDFGILMVLSWFSPQSIYDAEGTSHFNTKFVREDYFVPEFENLGLQPIYKENIIPFYSKSKGFHPSNSPLTGSSVASSIVLSPESLYGWQPRYSEYKSSYDRAHGEFKSGRSLSSFTIHRDTDFNLPVSSLIYGPDGSGGGLFNHHNRFGSDNRLISVGGLPNSFLFVDPACTNQIVEVAYDGHEDTDPFRISTRFSVTYISNMSVSGLPRL